MDIISSLYAYEANGSLFFSVLFYEAQYLYVLSMLKNKFHQVSLEDAVGKNEKN